MPQNSPELVTTRLPSGALCHALACPPEALPMVAPAALEAAWEVARGAAEAGLRGPARLLRFAGGTEIALADADACAWAEALDRAMPLDALPTLTLCLRLLALVEAMGRLPWLGALFVLSRDGAEFHPALLGAAARAPLDATGRFDETQLRAILARALPARDTA
jgi:hypothetical protein